AAGSCIGGKKACDLAVNATGDTNDGSCTASHCTLREAIVAANSKPDASAIGFAVDAGIVLTAPLPDVTAPLTIDGLGRKVTIDAGSKYRLFEAKAELTLAGLILLNGSAGKGNGGAIEGIGGLVTATDVAFRGNRASYGGAIAADGAVLIRCTFEDNQAQEGQSGGAVALAGASTVTDCVFTGNQAAGDGGGLAVFFGGLVVVTRSTFADNQAGGHGGGLACDGACAVANTTFSGNSAAAAGGNVFAKAAVELVHCTLVDGSAPEGAGLAATGPLTLTNSVVGGSKGGGSDCKATEPKTVGSWASDGSCGCATAPAGSLGSLGAWGGATATVPLPQSSTLVDAADDAGCGHPLVAGVDQRGYPRPAGAHCDAGAFEQAAAPCADLAATATCSDGDACTAGDTCKSGACAPGPAASCDDGNPCTDDACSAWAGCKHTATKASCDDGNPCTVKDLCAAGVCSGSPDTCDDGNSCTADACAAGVGCKHTALTGACSDGDPCTAADTCTGGKCAAGAKVCAMPSVAGLVGHWSAGDPTSLVTDANGHVAIWKDLSGNNHHLTASSGSPVVDKLGVYGRPAVDFSGGKGLATEEFALGAEATVFVVLRSGAAAANGAVAHHGNRNTDWSLEYASADSLRFQSQSDTAGAALPVKAGQSYVAVGRISAAARALWTVTSTTATKASGASSIATGNKVLYVGTSDAGEASNAVIGEILYYNKALSDDELQTVLAYLRIAWAFPAPKASWAWYDAAEASSLVYGNVKASDNSEIASWSDLSGLNRHAKSTVPPALAQAANGKAALSFTADQRMSVASQLAPTPQMSVFAVLTATPAAAAGQLAGMAGGAFALETAAAGCSGCAAQVRWLVAGQQAVAADLAAGKWQLVSLVHDKTAASLGVADAPPVTASVNALATAADTFVLGNAADGSAPLLGAIGELRVYGAAVSASDRAVIAAELKVKWGL
ncbi:MAG: CSLREA domain-containing protein, partial [Deltaproteobacteria bacterium]|nr:CSLREA domain-containing protein [Deltaproteobacteria bacterium]